MSILRFVAMISFSRWEDYFSFLNTHTKRLFKISTIVAMVTHWNACMQFMLATQVCRPAALTGCVALCLHQYASCCRSASPMRRSVAPQQWTAMACPCARTPEESLFAPRWVHPEPVQHPSVRRSTDVVCIELTLERGCLQCFL